MGYMDWIDLAEGRDRRRAFMNALMNFCIKCGEFLEYVRTY
jgi:hypothetical protein